jgi:polyhydroxybutyrate depolymerase
MDAHGWSHADHCHLREQNMNIRHGFRRGRSAAFVALSLVCVCAQAQLLNRVGSVLTHPVATTLRVLANVSGTVTSPVGDILVGTAQLAGPWLAHTVIRIQGRYLTLARGTAAVDVSFTYDGENRRFLIVRPATAYAGVPVLLMLHGNGGTAENQANISYAADLVAATGSWVVLPDALDGAWNDDPGYSNGIDDVGFLAAVIEVLTDNFEVDPQHIAISGLSDGAFMAERFACERSDLISATALVSGTMSNNLSRVCAPAQPRPIMFVDGTADPIVPYDGSRLGTMSATAAYTFWQTLHNCTPSAATTTQLPDGSNDGTTVDLLRNTGCGSGGEVRLYTVNGGGHAWPGGWQYLPIPIIGRTSTDLDATTELWNFVSAYAAN